MPPIIHAMRLCSFQVTVAVSSRPYRLLKLLTCTTTQNRTTLIVQCSAGIFCTLAIAGFPRITPYTYMTDTNNNEPRNSGVFNLGENNMDCVLKSEIQESLTHIQSTLERLDAFFSDRYNNAPAISLEPTEVFMAAWHKIKTARQTLSAIKLEEQDV